MSEQGKDPKKLLDAAQKQIMHLNRCAKAYSIAYQQLSETQKAQEREMRQMQETILDLEALLAESDAQVANAVAALRKLRGRMEEFREGCNSALAATESEVNSQNLEIGAPAPAPKKKVDDTVQFIEAHEQQMSAFRKKLNPRT